MLIPGSSRPTSYAVNSRGVPRCVTSSPKAEAIANSSLFRWRRRCREEASREVRLMDEEIRSYRPLVAALAEALRTILPEGICVTADTRHVIVQTRHGYDWLPIVDCVEANLDDSSIEEALEFAVGNCLNVLQDVVAHHLTEPWPHAPGTLRGAFVDYGVEVRDGMLRLWFGDRTAPFFPTIAVSLADVAIRES
jgi:hypothetical protein